MERGTWFFLIYLICCTAVSCLTMGAQTKLNNNTDRSALLALKARITRDPQNMISTNWSTTAPVCNWVGVTCGARHHRVAELNLSYFGLAGTVPPELGNLSFLVSLNFRNNSFHGTLPQELARLRRLKFLRLVYNKFMGVIPSWVGSLSKLQVLNLAGNQFSGSIPATIFNHSALQIISLINNELSGRIIKEVGNLTTLKEIYLDTNNFEEIPNEIGNLKQLETLWVQDNALKGAIPMVIFNMSSLKYLSLYGNSLNGTIPDDICQNLPKLQSLYLGENQFSGPLPSKFSRCNQLLELNLEVNKFTGRISNSIMNTSSLTLLSFYGNSLSGRIPKEVSNLTRIKVFDLGSNSLSGTIPYVIGYLSSLEILSLEDNILTGDIPSSIFNMSAITKLRLGYNQLAGSLPATIGLGLPNLEEFVVGSNHLRGVISKSISNASELRTLDLDGNSFSGYIPSTLCLLTNLEWVGFVSNNMTIDTSTPKANILSCLANLQKLRYLYFSDNPLNTKLSISFSNLSTSLQGLDLGNCGLRGNLSGLIPSDTGNLSSLILLDLHGNELSGPIPSSIGRLHNLQVLYMHENILQGFILDELCQLKNLVHLWLGGNQLIGSVPLCLGNLTASLRSLHLGSNLLNFTIPSTLWGLTYILRINLSSNSLIGSLSADIGNLKVATSIDISNNQLSGIIPSSVGSLPDLVNLSLAHNNLEGLIPSSLGICLSLERLDLSRNKLSGIIPKSLEALSYLKYLNLSYNRLQGEIPAVGPFKNLSGDSFVSNPGLCGAPQLKVPQCRRKAGISILKYVIPGILLAVLLATFIFWLLVSRRKKNVKVATSLTPQVLGRRVSYQELQRATNGFNESNLLGTGSFGSVYKGTLSDGLEVAIKVFKLESEAAFASFEVECEVLSNVRHRNLIKVISCCSQMDFKGLVLNYMPNGSLEKWLYTSSLNILQRLDIMIDVASALEYLHHGYEVPIVHCDLKPSNILLDDDMVAHVADFGIAKLMGGEDSMTQTMTLATIGYIAPEYGTEGIVTRRGDVYSFGIVLMETFTRRKPTDEIFVGEMKLNQWVANFLVADAIFEVVDATLLGTEEDHDFVSKRECLSSILRLAVACSAESPEERINMQEAVATLKKIKIKFSKDVVAGGVELNHLPIS